MFIQTHLQISDALIRSIPGFQIDRLAFQFGSTLPDFMPGMPDHTMENSVHYLDALVKDVRQVNPLEVSGPEKRNLFIKLGIITHYVSDYFCQPHNPDPRYKKLVPHILYENSLCFKSHTLDLENLSRKGLENYNDFLYPPRLSLMDYIQEQHFDYLAEKPDMNKDLQFAVQTSTNVIAAILNGYLLNCKAKAA